MRRLRLVSAVLVPLALLTACGGDDSGDSDAGSSDSSSSSDSGDSGDAPSEAPNVCEIFPAEDASSVSGLTLTAEEGPFDICEYGQEDPRSTSFSLGALLESELGGGAEVYFDGLTAGLTLEDESAPDIGEQARIVTGEFSGFSQTAGAALSDGVLYTVNLSPGDELDAAGELALAEELLRALVDAA
ncbi:hypothetical protein [Aeromicrobium sp. Leaf350]|uniref:hypothetical protein n=1 Tax=Aeromicrobium sp. Leaf350 TaxID=2876565 RepID=UPI001E3BD121|nr:hypothetical protein [Aeromicrobium sp. Leaf350]